jgi:uridine phosphorylase
MQHHLRLDREQLAGNDGLGRYVFLPGDPSRAARIAQHFAGLEVRDNARGFTAHLGFLAAAGTAPPVDVLAVSTGVGSASAEIVVHELIAAGARRLVRVGSCGTMASRPRPGQVVLVTGAVRDEATTAHYAPREYPALSHPDALAAMAEGARRAGLAAETFRGLCHSKASLYAREFGCGPAGERHREYAGWLRRCGVLATEMEASTLLVLAATATPAAFPLDTRPGAAECQAVAVLAVYATDESRMEFDADRARLADERAIRVAVEGVRAWAERDRGRDPL